MSIKVEVKQSELIDLATIKKVSFKEAIELYRIQVAPLFGVVAGMIEIILD